MARDDILAMRDRIEWMILANSLAASDVRSITSLPDGAETPVLELSDCPPAEDDSCTGKASSANAGPHGALAA